MSGRSPPHLQLLPSHQSPERPDWNGVQGQSGHLRPKTYDGRPTVQWSSGLTVLIRLHLYTFNEHRNLTTTWVTLGRRVTDWVMLVTWRTSNHLFPGSSPVTEPGIPTGLVSLIQGTQISTGLCKHTSIHNTGYCPDHKIWFNHHNFHQKHLI